MHHAFTGSARKPRQVNLSGRPAANPWTNLPGPSNKQATGNVAVANAQADRARRQHEKERLIASRKVQKTWRGHASRRKQKAEWRQEWDDFEKTRLGQYDTEFSNVPPSIDAARPYETQHDIQSQLRLLVGFQEYRRQVLRDPQDTTRLLRFASSLRRSSIETLDQPMRSRLCKLGIHAARHIRSIGLHSSGNQTEAVSTTDHLIQLASLISFLARLVPDDIGRASPLYMEVLKEYFVANNAPDLQQAGVRAIADLLSSASASTESAYTAFTVHILGDDTLSRNLPALESIASSIDRSALLKVLQRPVQKVGPRAQIWQVSYIIWVERHAAGDISALEKVDFVQTLSSLLGSCANEVSERLGVLDVPMNPGPDDLRPLDPFVLDNINSISDEGAVREAISVLSRQDLFNGSPTTNFDTARRLADYCVSILRAFATVGEKARNIRKWIWQMTVPSPAGIDISMVQCLWSTVAQVGVFKRICQSHRNVISALREAQPQTNQIGRAATTKEETDQWKIEWRIVLLLMELYSFVLKVIEDDEFFSSSSLTEVTLSQYGRRGLALQDAAILTTFLKNLTFVLYWNAAELVPSSEVEDLGALANLFESAERNARFSDSQAAPTTKVQTLAGNDVSHDYLKGLSTSLLRMLHERDSRRRFLPADHWLMTNQVDMTGFISAVVDEEEKRHQLDGDDGEGEEELIEDDFTTHAPQSLFAQRLSGSGGFNYSAATSRHGAAEKQKREARKKRMIESLAPRLEILRNLPFFIPFETRVQIFREFIYKDQARRRNGFVDPDIWRMSVARNTMGRDIDGRPPGHDIINRQHAEIHRESVFEDAYNAYYQLGDRLKEPIQISFIDQFGTPEAGIDGGGVTKEFLTSVTSEALDPTAEMPFFTENAQRYLYPNPVIWQEQLECLRHEKVAEGSGGWNEHLREFLRRYEFIGRVIGKCLYESILIDVNFAGFFLLKWALTGGNSVATHESGYRASINDLRDYDEELYQGLLKLKYYPGDVEADFGLNFTVNDTLHLPVQDREDLAIVKTIDLWPDGANKVVDNVMRHLYIDRMVKYRLQEQPEKVTNAFLRGLGQIISPSWLAMFNQKELQKLVGGDSTELDIADLRRNTLYGGLYTIGDDGLEHPTVELFWKAMQEMDDGDRRKVLKFVTSTPRAPLLGFSNLNPKFSIRDSSSDQERLPSTSTCVNLLKLPRYGDLQTMKDKLLYAAHAGAGFDLS
jgi:ubiquitin-protein ligase E3 C